jgi:adenylate kinase family enzyme
MGYGADQKNRKDDNFEAVSKKMAIFGQETKPLINFFEKIGSKNH